MKSPKIFFLAANTGRSQIYAQAMAKFKLLPDFALIFGENPRQTLVWPNIKKSTFSLQSFKPNMNEQLCDTLEKARVPTNRVAVTDVNDHKIYREIIKTNPKLIIYSGYGGQIIKSKLLSLGIQVLHIHAGLLPDYKGSTTIYYSWLKEGQCSVSAIILEDNIDTGPVIACKTHPLPPKGVDVDIVFDSCLRADLMIEVLGSYFQNNQLEMSKKQTSRGKTYYVIHPLLKHIALISQEKCS